MEPAIQERTTDLVAHYNRKLVVLQKPDECADLRYQQFLMKLQSYACGYWKWLRKPRIREVFVVRDMINPTKGRIDKIAIKRKANDFIELKDSARFDMKTGRSLYGEPRYILPVDDHEVWAAWEPQSLRRRVEAVLPALCFSDVRVYADLVAPGCFGIFQMKFDRPCRRDFTRAAALLTEGQAAAMASCWKSAKEAILGHLPEAIEEFRALVAMMERDAK